MKLSVPKEVRPGERRVAATPENVARLIKMGFAVAVEHDAGAAASFGDDDYVAAGAEIVPDTRAIWQTGDILLKVQPPSMHPSLNVHEAELIREGGTLISFLYPGKNKDIVDRLAARKATAIAVDQIPRISRAQKMDALSSMANIAGYRAVIEAASFYGRFFTGQMTAAGRVPPAKVLVIGAGVAGLAAIGAARGMGAIVRAFDTRPTVKEQVKSMGAEFIELKVVERYGVHILGYMDLPSRLAPTASLLYGNNLTHLLADLGGASHFHLDLADEVVRGALVTRNGEVLWPPPPRPPAALPPDPKAVAAKIAPAAAVKAEPRRSVAGPIFALVAA